MHTWTWVAFAAFAVTTTHLAWRASRFWSHSQHLADTPQTDRDAVRGAFQRRAQQMITAVGLWQLSLAAVMFSTSTAQGVGVSGFSVAAVGLFMIGMARVWAKVGLP